MNVAPTTAAPGTCGACSSPLAAGQRYCIACGERRAELPPPFRPPERAPQVFELAAAAPPRGVLGGRRSFGAVGAVVLASGVLIGAAVGPALTPASFASTAGQLIVVATGGGDLGTAASQAGGASGAAGSGQLATPTGNVATPPTKIVNRGGGAAPAQPAAAVATPTTPTAPTTPPTTTPPVTPPPTTPAEDPTVTGTVVHLSHTGHGYAVATKEGQLFAFHSAKAPTALGDRLKVTVRALQNGTFQERSIKLLGHVDKASFHGTVTFADAQAGAYTVSARGVSLLIHLPPPPPPSDPAAPPPTAPPPPAPQVPAVGVLTTLDVTLKPSTDPAVPPQLEEAKRVDGDPAVGDLDLEAIVRDPDPANPNPDPAQLLVSADDAGESPSTLSLHVPPKLDVSKLKPGTVISALVKREADGSYTLTSATDDSDRKSADRAQRPAVAQKRISP